jgi:hypothetical protein
MMATGKRDFSTSVHELKLTLDHTDPPVWRRLQVPSMFTLADLHRIIQVAMPWLDYHLHQFLIGNRYYSAPGMLEEPDVVDERTVRLADVAARKGRVLRYEYDFGDSWEHTITVEDILDPEAGKRYPVCLDGERAGPPEDCGGVWGYARLLRGLEEPDNPEYAHLLEWLGRPFDPAAFSPASVNRRPRSTRFSM